MNEKNILKAVSVAWSENSLSLAGTEARKDIIKIIFLNTVADSPQNAKDVSEKQNGTILCWTENGTMKIAGNGKVYANPNSDFLFKNYTNVKEIDFANVFDTCNATSMKQSFSGCEKVEVLEVAEWNTSRITNLQGTFAGCYNLKEIDVSKWDTSQVTDMQCLFASCISLMKLDVRNWNTSNVVTMRRLFGDCNQLRELDLSKWDVSQVRDLSQLFFQCGSLRKVNISDWKVSNVREIDNMLSGCSLLEDCDIDLSRWDVSSVKWSYVIDDVDPLQYWILDKRK